MLRALEQNKCLRTSLIGENGTQQG